MIREIGISIGGACLKLVAVAAFLLVMSPAVWGLALGVKPHPTPHPFLGVEQPVQPRSPRP